MTSAVFDLYNRPADVDLTWERRERYSRVDTEVVRVLLAEHLPGAPAEVADVGGGNGYLAFHLTAQGYRVSLSDFVPALVADARRRDAAGALADIRVADARDLPYPNSSADAVLLFGPLYGLAELADRAAALTEAHRILRPGGVLVTETLTKAAGLRGLIERDVSALARVDLDRFLATGVFVGPDLPRFYRGHVCADPDDTTAELRAAGFTVADVVAVDLPHPDRQRLVAEAGPDVVAGWTRLVLAVGRDPRYWATANHVVHVARRL
ncbi:class I SAM-dependent methyltransferase [Actinoplanes sp. NPDC051411]|uniref:class I SAM-dependent methyltransferase n=1 Tax=Actinoplanes sp. NPDC051411 TaxID=3155522 RepID=UPI00342128CA